MSRNRSGRGISHIAMYHDEESNEENIWTTEFFVLVADYEVLPKYHVLFLCTVKYYPGVSAWQCLSLQQEHGW